MSHKRTLTNGSPSVKSTGGSSLIDASPRLKTEPKKRRLEESFDDRTSVGSDEIDDEDDRDGRTRIKTDDQRWERPDVDEAVMGGSTDLVFQQIDVDEGMFGVDARTSVRVFGITKERNSVLMHVMNFRHYLYLAAPARFQSSDCAGFVEYVNNCIGVSGAVVSASIEMRESIYGWQGNVKTGYIRLVLAEPKLAPKVRIAIEHGQANYQGMWGRPAPGEKLSVMTFDNIQYSLRFMIDVGMVGMGWVTVPAGKFRHVDDLERLSTCQIEVEVDWADLVAHPVDGEWAAIAPLRILSMDIECAGRKGIFPDPAVDPVIQIANVVTEYGSTRQVVRNVFTLGTCSPIAGAQVLSFRTEAEMMMGWRKFVTTVDPDIIIGYNTTNFDFPYLLDRAGHLRLERFPFWGRLRFKRTEARKLNLQSKQMGNRDMKQTNTEGRLQLDLLQCVQRDYQLRSYTLNSVCAKFLGEQKEDVHHSAITDLQNGDENTRRRLAVYCIKDAYLPQRLLEALMFLVNYAEMARVTGVPFGMLLTRGQQIKFLSQLFRKARSHRLVIPNLQPEGNDDQYEGATVIEPRRGYYDTPIATLDFASLYPSIIQAHNLCYTTLLTKESIAKASLERDRDYISTPNGDLFCTPKIRKGLLSLIFEELLGARKLAKKELAVETDVLKKAVLNGRQLALKISANSVYGLTGAANGKLPCLAIASSTTSYGRNMIERTKREVEERYTIANGYGHDATVIYGDTDSVMVKFGPPDLETAMKLGREAAEYVSSKFQTPIRLEFEKVYFPYLLINKKRYAGLYWTRPDKWDKMDSKGIETVRRDNCRLVQTVIETALRMLLIDRDVAGAEQFVKATIADLLQNKVDLSNLVITKALAKADYANKQPHVELAERMRKRDAGSAPALGDRVAYVIIRGAAGAKNYERSEDPLYVLEHNIPIDTRYYLDNQLAKPLCRIFEPILGDRRAGQLLTGEHTRAISVAAPTTGGLMKFAKKTATCLGCKTPLRPGDGSNTAVCVHCQPKAGELYEKSIAKTSGLEVKFARLWTQCQRCQESVHNKVICASRDCPIFYMRMKAGKDVEEAHRELARFDCDW